MTFIEKFNKYGTATVRITRKDSTTYDTQAGPYNCFIIQTFGEDLYIHGFRTDGNTQPFYVEGCGTTPEEVENFYTPKDIYDQPSFLVPYVRVSNIEKVEVIDNPSNIEVLKISIDPNKDLIKTNLICGIGATDIGIGGKWLYNYLVNSTDTSEGIYHDIYIDGTNKPTISIHTHHNIENAIVQTYMYNSVSTRNNDVNQTANIEKGNWEYVGYVNKDTGLLNERTFEFLLDAGKKNRELNIITSIGYVGVAFKFRDFISKQQTISGNTDYASIQPDGTHAIDINVYEEPKLDYIHIRFFEGKPPQEVIDESRTDDDMGTDQPTYDYEENKTATDEDYSTTDDIEDGSDEGSAGIFHDIYKVSNVNIKSLHNKIWSQDYYNVLKVNENPIENIVSCKRFPFDMSGGADKEIVIGNISTGVNGTPLSAGIYKTNRWTIDVLPKYRNFLDYFHTNITLFLPCVGYTPLDTHAVMNKKLGVEYLIDIMTGVCKARIFVNDELLMERDGQIGIDCTLTSSNQKQSEIANSFRLINSGAQIFSGVAGKDAGTAISGLEGLFNNNITNHFQSTSSNAPISNASKIECYLIYDRPVPVVQRNNNNPYPSNYPSTVGYPCYNTMYINQCSGYTKCGADIKGSFSIATEREQNEIFTIMQGGFEV